MTNEDRIILDYMLGWMSPSRRRRMNRHMESNPALRAEVDAWQASLAPLSGICEPIVPPEDTWTGIQARLNAPVAGTRWRLPRWGWAGGGAALATVAALLILPAPEPYRADLREGPTATRTLATVETTRHDRLVVTETGLPTSPPGKSLELWIIPKGGTPRSLGVLANETTQTPQLDKLPPHATFAISLEPAGGSPTGQPTGPVLASGEMQRE